MEKKRPKSIISNVRNELIIQISFRYHPFITVVCLPITILNFLYGKNGYFELKTGFKDLWHENLNMN